jgi:hypothetical protein
MAGKREPVAMRGALWCPTGSAEMIAFLPGVTSRRSRPCKPRLPEQDLQRWLDRRIRETVYCEGAGSTA